MPSRLCYILHIHPALNSLGGENSIISPDLYSSFPLEVLPRLVLSLCMVSAQLGGLTLPSLCNPAEPPGLGNMLGAADPKPTPLLGATLGLRQLHGKL